MDEHEEGRPPTGQPAPSNLILVSQTVSNAKPLSSNSHSASASTWSDWLERLADGDAWVPWLEFVDTARVMLGLDTEFHAPSVDRPSTLWRAVRPAVLESLDQTGLLADVVATTGVLPIDEHAADLAGHVRLRRRLPADTLHAEADDGLTAELVLIAGAHNLAPAPVPRATLRQFVGQWATECEPELNGSLFRWFDHARTWTDVAGSPVLSIETSAEWQTAWTEITAALLLHEIPLVLQGPHEGARSENGQLFLLRFDPAAPPVPAVHSTGTPWALRDPAWTPAITAAECRRHFGCVGIGCEDCGRCDCALPVCPRCLRCAEHAVFGDDSDCFAHLWWSPSEACWLEAA